MKREFLKLMAGGAAASLFASKSAIAQQPTQVWKMAIPVGEKSWFGEMYKWWGTEVEKRTGGKISVQYYWGDSLVKWPDALPGIQSGIADLAWVNSTYFPASFPNYMILDQIFNFGDDYVAAIKAAIDTMENQPDLKEEIEKQDIVFLMPHISGHDLVGARKSLSSVKDLKGKTVRTYGGSRVDFYKLLEANPVFMPFNTLYSAIDRGTVDVVGDMPLVLSNAFKLSEVIKNAHYLNPVGTKGNGGAIASGYFMSGSKFRSLPKEVQNILLQLRVEYSERYGQSLMALEKNIKNEWSKNGVVFYDSSPEDEKIVLQAGNTANDNYFKREEQNGHKNVRKVWAHFQNARKKYEQKKI